MTPKRLEPLLTSWSLRLMRNEDQWIKNAPIVQVNIHRITKRKMSSVTGCITWPMKTDLVSQYTNNTI